jgi:hypothetical protein
MSFANARTLEKTSRSSRTWALDTTRLVQLVLLANLTTGYKPTV